MRIDPPHHAWYRPDEQPPAGRAAAAALRSRDVATARALQAYLSSRPTTAQPTRVATVL